MVRAELHLAVEDPEVVRPDVAVGGGVVHAQVLHVHGRDVLGVVLVLLDELVQVLLGDVHVVALPLELADPVHRPPEPVDVLDEEPVPRPRGHALDRLERLRRHQDALDPAVALDDLHERLEVEVGEDGLDVHADPRPLPLALGQDQVDALDRLLGAAREGPDHLVDRGVERLERDAEVEEPGGDESLGQLLGHQVAVRREAEVKAERCGLLDPVDQARLHHRLAAHVRDDRVPARELRDLLERRRHVVVGERRANDRVERLSLEEAPGAHDALGVAGSPAPDVDDPRHRHEPGRVVGDDRAQLLDEVGRASRDLSGQRGRFHEPEASAARVSWQSRRPPLPVRPRWQTP